MFLLLLSNIDELVLFASTSDESRIWHGHLHFNALKLLNQKSMVVGLPSIVCIDGVCEG